jgi:hypothetical protein
MAGGYMRVISMAMMFATLMMLALEALPQRSYEQQRIQQQQHRDFADQMRRQNEERAKQRAESDRQENEAISAQFQALKEKRDRKRAELQASLKRCGNCPQRASIQHELDQMAAEDLQHRRTVCAQLERTRHLMPDIAGVVTATDRTYKCAELRGGATASSTHSPVCDASQKDKMRAIDGHIEKCDGQKWVSMAADVFK